MRILFVSSGNYSGRISPIIKAQGNSLQSHGIIVDYFPINGKGIWGYLKGIKPLRKSIKLNTYDVVHAHYSLSSYIALLAKANPLVVSLMGSDLSHGYLSRFIIILLHKYLWSKTIVKSEQMQNELKVEGSELIPNGVDLDVFRPLDKEDCRRKLGWSNDTFHILFLADPDRPEKNFKLANSAVNLLKSKIRINLHVLKNIEHNDVPLFINSADLNILCSLWEGSPNVIKEAMACCVPIVATNVGDIKWIFENIEGCYISSFDEYEFAKKIEQALTYQGKTEGWKRIIELKLDANSVAEKLIKVYYQVAKGK